MKSKDIFHTLGILFKTPVKKKLIVKWGHYGAKSKNFQTDKIDEAYLVYNSCRDVSGELKIEENDKMFLMLNLNLIVNYDDETSQDERNRQLRVVEDENEDKKLTMKTEEINELEGFEPHLMMKLNRKEKKFIDCNIYYFLIVCIPIVEIYKYYIESICVHKDFTIKKVISTHSDINDTRLDSKYKQNNPVISIDNKIINLEFYLKDDNINTNKTSNLDVVTPTPVRDENKTSYLELNQTDTENSSLTQPLIQK